MVTYACAASGLLRWQIFEKTLLVIVVLDLALGGNGYLFKIGGFRLREILFFFCMMWVVLRLTSIEPIRLDAKLLGLTGLFVAITAFSTALGYFNASRVEAIVAELKPLSYFPMLLFFLVAVRTRNDLTLIASLFIACGTLLASSYLLLLVSAKIGLVEYSSIFDFLSVSDEFIFRHYSADEGPGFIGFLYKGAFYICIAALFLIFDPFRITKVLAAVTVVAIAMTLTRGLCLAVATCILAGVGLNRNWKQAPWRLGQCALLLAVLFFARQAEVRLGRAGDSRAPAAAEIAPGNLGDKNPTPAASSGTGGCSSGSACGDAHSTFQDMQRPTDSGRMEDVKFIIKAMDFSMIAVGRGLGAPIRGRERIELNYFEILYKQGILGLSIWFALFLYTFKLYRAVPPETKQFGLAFFLSGLFVFITTASNTFLTGSIGMGAVFIATASLLVLAQENPTPVQRSAWYGEWLDRILRV